MLSTLWEVQKGFTDKLEEDGKVTVTFMEEFSELIYSLCKLEKAIKDYGGVKQALKDKPQLFHKLLESITDAEICLKQLEYFLGKYEETYEVQSILEIMETDKIKSFALKNYDKKVAVKLIEDFAEEYLKDKEMISVIKEEN